jgi:hypothetical protein
MRIGAETEWIPLVKTAVAARSAPRAKSASTAKAAFEVLDTVSVEKPGYYAQKRIAFDTLFGPDAFAFRLYRNSLYGLAPSEVDAWKEHLIRARVEIRLSDHEVRLPDSLDAGVVVLADGSAPFWKLIDSFRARRIDSLGASPASFRLSWDWPQGVFATPDKDWMDLALMQIRGLQSRGGNPGHARDGVRQGWIPLRYRSRTQGGP